MFSPQSGGARGRNNIKNCRLGETQQKLCVITPRPTCRLTPTSKKCQRSNPVKLTLSPYPLCLDLFALNVPTCFAFRFTIFGKSTPHFAHRSLPQGARGIKVTFGNFEKLRVHRLMHWQIYQTYRSFFSNQMLKYILLRYGVLTPVQVKKAPPIRFFLNRIITF